MSDDRLAHFRPAPDSSPAPPSARLSPRRLASNRRNALKSTGPLTKFGKGRSALNARKSEWCPSATCNRRPFRDPAADRRATVAVPAVRRPAGRAEASGGGGADPEAWIEDALKRIPPKVQLGQDSKTNPSEPNSVKPRDMKRLQGNGRERSQGGYPTWLQSITSQRGVFSRRTYVDGALPVNENGSWPRMTVPEAKTNPSEPKMAKSNKIR